MAAFLLFRPPVFRAAVCRAPVVQLCVLKFFWIRYFGWGRWTVCGLWYCGSPPGARLAFVPAGRALAELGAPIPSGRAPEPREAPSCSTPAELALWNNMGSVLFLHVSSSSAPMPRRVLDAVCPWNARRSIVFQLRVIELWLVGMILRSSSMLFTGRPLSVRKCPN